MRKKELINLNESLLIKIKEADVTLMSKNDEIELLKDKIKLLEAEILRLKESINSQESVSEVCDNCENVEVKFDPTPVNFENFDVVDIITDLSEISVHDYAVKAVSKLILETTKTELFISSNISSLNGDTLNLLLGSSENAKNQIFSVINENLPFDDSCLKIDKILNNTLDYFKKISLLN